MTRHTLRFALLVAVCLSLGAERDSGWRAVRQAHLRREPECVACGQTTQLEVHHILPFSNEPRLELDPDNLVTLCKRDHLVFGHFGNWQRYNPKVREHATTYHEWKEKWEKD